MMTTTLHRSVLLVFALFLGGCASTPPSVIPSTPRRSTVAVQGVSADDAMLGVLAPYRAEVAKLDRPIGESVVDIDVKSPELALLVSDVMLEAAMRITGRQIDAAFTNTGGVRASLAVGPVSYMTVTEILPFDNTIVILEVSGDQARQLFETLYLRNSNLPVAGVRFTGTGDRMDSVSIGGEPFDPARLYLVATNNFLSNGGGNMEMLRDVRQSDTGVFLRDAMADHVKALAARGEKLDRPANQPRHDIEPESGT